MSSFFSEERTGLFSSFIRGAGVEEGPWTTGKELIPAGSGAVTQRGEVRIASDMVFEYLTSFLLYRSNSWSYSRSAKIAQTKRRVQAFIGTTLESKTSSEAVGN